MATVVEKFGSRRITFGQNPRAEYLYDVLEVVTVDDDYEALVKAAIETASPAEDFDLGLPRQDIEIERLGEHHWEARVIYQSSRGGGFLTPGESSFNFEIGGGTQHITQSKETIARHAPVDETPPDFKGAIGVTADSVEGVDIVAPVFNFSETHLFPATQVTESYKGTIFRLVGKTNVSQFRAYLRGEVLFLGAAGARRGTNFDDPWEISFRFAASPNVTGLVVGDITGIDKRGHEYVWVRYADAEDETSGTIVKKPTSVHVERVYDEGNFSGLQIG